MSVIIHVCFAQGTTEKVRLAHRISERCRWIPPLAFQLTCILLRVLRPGLAMAILAAILAGVILCCRPTPGRILRWIKVAFFPERAALRGPSPEVIGEDLERPAA